MKRVLILLLLGVFLISLVSAQEAVPTQINANNVMEVRTQIRAGEYNIEGRQIMIEERAGNRIRLRSQGVFADTELELEEDITGPQGKLKARLSNGINAEIKTMPDTASETAIARLKLKVCSEENNCTIELKEVRQGNETRAAYEVKVKKKAIILGLFRARMNLESQIDAETGEVIRTKRPWWAFLAIEDEEVSDEILQEALLE